MALSCFDDPAHPPDPAALAAALGPSAAAWERLVADVTRAHAPVDAVWHLAGARYGWSLRLVRKKRVLLYLIPQRDHFLVGVVLGERAVAGAREAGLPAPVLALLDAARPYAEGRGIRLPIREPADVDVVLRLAELKAR